MKNQRTIYLSLVLALLLGALTILLLQGNAPVSAGPAQDSPADAAPPVAGFTHSAPDEWGTSTTFTNTTTFSGTVSYFWEFGDGGTSAETHPTHVYPATGIYTVTLTAANAGGASVAAELVVVYGYGFFTSQTGGWGIMGPVNLSIYGPKQSPSYGDAYSCPKAHVSGQPPSYDPTSDPSAPDNPNRADFQDWRGYPFRIHIAASVTGMVRVEILDPDTYNAPPATIHMTQTLPVTSTVTFDLADTVGRVNPYVVDRWTSPPSGDESDPNRFWFVRMDANRVYLGTPSYNDAYNTTTEYRLYYIARQPDGSLERVYIATYTGQPDNSHDTDLKWVCPGGSASQDPQVGTVGHNGFPASFEVDMAALAGIAAQDDGSRSLYLEVEGVDGWSENGFDLWAGPATPENLAAPADVNARNLWIYRQQFMGLYPHNAAGVVTFGDSVLPLNTNAGVMYQITPAYLSEAVRGFDLSIYHWDNDMDGQNICYWFQGFPIWGEAGATCDEGEVEGFLSGGNSWTPPPEGHDWMPVPGTWVGGYLSARYSFGTQDNSTWRLTLDLDTTPPWSEMDVLPAYQVTTTFGVSWSGYDDVSGDLIYDIQFRDGAGGTWTDWLTSTGFVGASFSGTDGHTYYFRSRARDGAGNAEPYPTGDGDAHTTVDATPPVGSLVIDGGAEATADLTVTLTISATDSTSGLALMQFSDDGVSFSSWETYTTTKEWTLTGGDGTKTVYVRFQDNASNTSPAYVDTIILDTTAPTGSILVEGGTEVVSITQVTLALSATDAYTVTEMRLRNDAEAWGSWEPYDTSRAWTLPDQNGEHTVWVQFRDQFGNVSLAYSDSIVYQPPLYLPLVLRDD
jgi:PKD repeat protein